MAGWLAGWMDAVVAALASVHPVKHEFSFRLQFCQSIDGRRLVCGETLSIAKRLARLSLPAATGHPFVPRSTTAAAADLTGARETRDRNCCWGEWAVACERTRTSIQHVYFINNLHPRHWTSTNDTNGFRLSRFRVYFLIDR